MQREWTIHHHKSIDTTKLAYNAVGVDRSLDGRLWNSSSFTFVLNKKNEILSGMVHYGDDPFAMSPIHGYWGKQGLGFSMFYPDENGNMNVYKYEGKGNEILKRMEGVWNNPEYPEDKGHSGYFDYVLSSIDIKSTLKQGKLLGIGVDISEGNSHWISPQIEMDLDGQGKIHGKVIYTDGASNTFSGNIFSNFMNFELLFTPDQDTYIYSAVIIESDIIGTWHSTLNPLHPDRRGSFVWRMQQS